MVQLLADDRMNVDLCISAVSSANAKLKAGASTYAVFGLEYGRECWAATSLIQSQTSLIGNEACPLSCKGASTMSCGGRAQYNYYVPTTYAGSLASTSVPRAILVLIIFSIGSTVYLYNYSTFHRCAFPLQAGTHDPAPFRLLALGDPQLEGDSSLPNPDDALFPSIINFWQDLAEPASIVQRLQVTRQSLTNLVASDLPRILHSCRKRLDLLGNDYYLAHIYRTLHRKLDPTHVTVLGDLLGSQWISDEEFESRGWRYWQRAFQDGRRVDDDISSGIQVGHLGQDDMWKRRIINVAGNHDVGYAGDMNNERIQRFEKIFGRTNWETRFRLGPDSHTNNTADAPELRIIILNSLNLDTPAVDPGLQSNTYGFINNVIVASRPVEDETTGTILLTHLPLHKEEGVCVDRPFFDFYDEDEGSGVKEQNHLSYNAGKGILEGIYGMSGNPQAPHQGLGRNGIILTGHDHEGCDVHHHLPYHPDPGSRAWSAERWVTSTSRLNETIPGIREITVRSMMGEFGGNAGLLSAWFDDHSQRWRFEYSTCSLGVQHIWWAIHVLDLVTIGLASLAVLGNSYSVGA
ncbi:MAG: hypothetical protein Q9212_004328 [Teloschistes hypoglaucus]